MKPFALPTISARHQRAFRLGLCLQDEHSAGQLSRSDSVSQLKEGMTRSQVRFLLALPWCRTRSMRTRWDYYYFFSSQKDSRNR
jgi:outer membrane protein assembly factor BamE (lipoprotein component of BamABCDE complex)